MPIRRSGWGRRARAVSGHTVAMAPTSVTNAPPHHVSTSGLGREDVNGSTEAFDRA